VRHVATGRIYAERAAFFDHQTTLRETPVATGRIYAERTAFFDYQTTLRETYVATGRIYAERAAFFGAHDCRDDYMETREGVDFDVAGSVHQFRDRIVVFADPSRLAYLPPFTRRCNKVKVL